MTSLGYTPHGHKIPGLPHYGPEPTSRARCGGVNVCRECGRYRPKLPWASEPVTPEFVEQLRQPYSDRVEAAARVLVRSPFMIGRTSIEEVLELAKEVLAAADLAEPAEGVLSDTSVDGRRLTWKELAEQARETAYRAQDWRRMVSDLDRNVNGRHEGDVDGGDPTGVSQGNPLLPTGTVLGYSIGGARRAYVMPEWAERHKFESWERDVSGDIS